MHFKRANTEPSMDFRKANTEPSMPFQRANTDTYQKQNVNLFAFKLIFPTIFGCTFSLEIYVTSQFAPGMGEMMMKSQSDYTVLIVAEKFSLIWMRDQASVEK